MFQIEQTYNLVGLTVLCRAARKIVRRWARIFRTVMWVIFAMGTALIALALALGITPTPWALPAFAAMLILLLTEDRINAWIAQRQLLPGSAHSTTVFTPDTYTVTTDTTVTDYRYENITGLCESADYFIFFFGTRHGQLFDKRCFRVGAPDGFRDFIEQKTGIAFQKIK